MTGEQMALSMAGVLSNGRVRRRLNPILTGPATVLAVGLTLWVGFEPYRDEMGQKNYQWVRRVGAVAALFAGITGSIENADATALPDCGGAGAGACGQLFVTPAVSGPGGLWIVPVPLIERVGIAI